MSDFDDVGRTLGKIVGGILGFAGGAVVTVAKGLAENVQEHSTYVKCPYCKCDVRVMEYRSSLTGGSNDDGWRKCSKCESYFLIK